MEDRSSQDGQERFLRLDDARVVRCWCGFWGCTEAQLRQAVQAVGNSVEAIHAFLKRNP